MGEKRLYGNQIPRPSWAAVAHRFGFETSHDARWPSSERRHFDGRNNGVNRFFSATPQLNTGDYEGGYLRFPEYGPDLYRPAAGDAVVFSCELVHEATPVTRGERYVLLAVFYTDEET